MFEDDMPGDPYARRLLYFVFMGSKGGVNRIKIISQIRKQPLNANQLSKELGLDYKAIQHHIGVLEKNNLISKMGDKYAVTYFISNFLEVNLEVLDEMISKLEKGK